MRNLVLSMLLLLISAAAGSAQPAKPDPAELPALRYELGQRLRRFEAAWEKQERAEPRRRALVHLEKLTQQFFSFQFGEAGRALDRAGFALLTEDEPGISRQWVWCLHAIPELRVVDGAVKEVNVTIKPLYPVKGNVPNDLELQLWFTDKQITRIKPTEFPHTVKVPLPPLGEFKGLDRKLYFMAEAGKEMRYTALGISQVSDLKKQLESLKKQIDALEAFDTIEKATTRDRLVLLESLSEGTAPETDLPAADLLANAAKMLDGKPFFTSDKSGQFWMSIPVDGKRAAPVRVFVPRLLDDKKPVPVVFALHGAGGSENLFFEGYGGGRIVTECRKRGWLLVGTRSGFVGGAPPVPALLEQLAKRYPIDAKNVMIVGHSMGAMQTIELVQKQPKLFAAAAVLGGGGTVRDAKVFTEFPLFIGVGEKDFLLTSARGLNKTLTESGAKKTTYKEYPDIEHLVIVREALQDVFEMFEEVAKGK